MSAEYEKLKSLLFKDEMADLSAFRQLLEDDDQLAQRLSEVLTQATKINLKKDPAFKKQFIPKDSRPYLKALKGDRKGLLALLSPIISPAIRQAVIQSMRSFIAEVNRTLEMGFSIKALKWRWQAFRSGVSFSQIVFEHTVQYQVEHLFLVDKETGLLSAYAGQQDNLHQDKEAMSAMLTAIQDFIKDSIDSAGEGLTAAEMGENLWWVFPGSQADLVAIIKGAPGNQLRTQLSDLSDLISREYHAELKDVSHWTENPIINDLLNQYLIEKAREEDKNINYWPWLLAGLLLMSWLAYNSYNKHQRQQRLNAQIENTPGLVVKHIDKSGSTWVIHGLLDPLADTANITEATLKTSPFVSLDDPLLAKRIEQFINNPNMQVTVKQGHVTIDGVNNEDIDTQVLKLIPGVVQVTDRTEKVMTLDRFLAIHPTPEGLLISENEHGINVSGQIIEAKGSVYMDLVRTNFPAVDDSNVTFIPERNQLLSQINKDPILINLTQGLSDENKQSIDQIIKWNDWIEQHYQSGKLRLISRSDCQGSLEESHENNQIRLDLVMNYLQAVGINTNNIETASETCEALTDVIDPQRLGVWFEKH